MTTLTRWMTTLSALLIGPLTGLQAADSGQPARIRVQEVDGAPSFMAGSLVFGNGTVTQSGSQATIANGGGGSGTVTSFVFTNGGGFTGTVSTPTTTPTLGIVMQNAAADASTKGQATFEANDFNSTTGLIAIDYANGQAAASGVKGFLSAADWALFTAKLSPTNGEGHTINTTYSAAASGSITINGTLGNDAVILLTGNVTASAITNLSTGKRSQFRFWIVQDGTGSRTFAWPTGTASPTPTIETAAGAVTIVDLVTRDNGTTWYATTPFAGTATTTTTGVVQFSTNGETTASEAVQGSDGRLTKRLGFWTPEAGMWQLASGYATYNTRNGRPVYEFTADGTTAINVRFVVTEQAILTSGIKFRLRLMGATATSGVMRFGVKLERGNTDSDSASFDTGIEADATANGTSGIETVLDITLTNLDGLAVGEEAIAQIYKNGDHANDTMTGLAQIKSAEALTAN